MRDVHLAGSYRRKRRRGRVERPRYRRQLRRKQIRFEEVKDGRGKAISVSNQHVDIYRFPEPRVLRRVLIVELNGNVAQTYSRDGVTVISVHRLLNSRDAANNWNATDGRVDIPWPKVIRPSPPNTFLFGCTIRLAVKRDISKKPRVLDFCV